MRNNRITSARPGLGLVLPAALMVIWELSVRFGLLDAVFYPPPSQLARAAARLWASGDLLTAMLATLTRALLGFIPGALAGAAIGAAMGSSAAIRQMVEPSLSSLYSVPKLALLPIFLLMLGVGETARLALISLGTALTMSIQLFDGVRGIDSGYVEMARNYGASRWALLKKVYFPGAMPSLFTGSRITLGRAIVLAISVELVTGSPGLGSMIWLAWQTFSTERLYVSVIAAGLIGYLSQTAILALEKRVLRWRYC